MTAARRSGQTRDWSGAWTGERFTHEAFVFSDDEAVRARVVPFVEEGLSRGEPVIVVADDQVRGVLTQDLGRRVDELAVFAPSGGFWQGSHATLAAYQESMEPLLATGALGEWWANPAG